MRNFYSFCLSAFFILNLSAFGQKVFNENFENPTGWLVKNKTRPAPEGPITWHKPKEIYGENDIGWSQNGSNNSYLQIGYTPFDKDNAAISQWLFSPMINSVKNGDKISFYAKAKDMSLLNFGFGPGKRADRLIVRLSISENDSTAPYTGIGEHEYGNFTYLLKEINPTLTKDGFPHDKWTKYEATVSGLPDGKVYRGRVGFWYYVTNAGYNNEGGAKYEIPDEAALALEYASMLIGEISQGAGFLFDMASLLVDATLYFTQEKDRGYNGTYVGIDNFTYDYADVFVRAGDKATDPAFTSNELTPSDALGTTFSHSMCGYPNELFRSSGDIIARSYKIYNWSKDPIIITDTALTGLDRTPSEFKLYLPDGNIIPAGGSRDLVVVFEPKLSGWQSARVTVSLSSTEFPSISFKVRGHGQDPWAWDYFPRVLCHTNLTTRLSDQGTSDITPFDLDSLVFDKCGQWDLSWYNSSNSTLSARDAGKPKHMTIKLTNDAGRWDTCGTKVEVIDETVPKMTCPTSGVTLYLPANSNKVPTSVLVTPPASDSSGAVTVYKSWNQYSTTAFPDSLGIGTHIMVWRAVDPSGNYASCGQTIWVVDTVKPIAICKEPFYVGFENANGGTLTVEDVNDTSYDNSGGRVTCLIARQGSSTFGYTIPFTCAEGGTDIHVKMQVTDESGNVSIDTTSVRVATPGTVTCRAAFVNFTRDKKWKSLSPKDVFNSNGSDCNVTNVSLSKSYFDCSNIGSNWITVNYTDINGAQKSCQTVVVVKDQTINKKCITSDTVIYSDYGYGGMYFEAPLSFPCTNNPKWSLTASGRDNYTDTGLVWNVWRSFPVGATTVTTRIVNPYNKYHVVTCSRTVVVKDTTPPEILYQPADVSALIGSDVCSQEMDIVPPFDFISTSAWRYELSGATTYNAQWPTYYSEQPAKAMLNSGTTTVTLHGFDFAGNTASVSYDVTLTHTQKPYASIICPKIGYRLVSECDGIYDMFVDKPLLMPCGFTGYTWSYEVYNNNNLIYSRNSIHQDSGAYIPVPVSSDYRFGYNDVSNNTRVVFTSHMPGGADGYSCVFYPNFTDTVRPLVCPDNDILENTNNTTYKYDYTLESPIDTNCANDKWRYTVTGATTLSSGSTSDIDYDEDRTLALNNGLNTIKLWYLSPNGNTSSCSYTVRINDVSTPVITCPANITINRGVSSDCKISTGGCQTISGFTGPYSMAKIEKKNSNPSIVIDDSNAPDSIKFQSISGTQFSYDGYIKIPITCSGTVSFNWEYKSRYPYWAKPFYDINNYNPKKYANHSSFAGFDQNESAVQSGTFSQNLNEGDVLYIGLLDGGIVDGYLNIKNFSAQGFVPNAEFVPIYVQNAGLNFITDLKQSYLPGDYTITNTVIAPSGNSASCTQNLSVVDESAFSLVCKDATLYFNEAAMAYLQPQQVLSSCGNTNITLSKSEFNRYFKGVNDVIVSGYNELNQLQTCTARVTILDTIRPSVIANKVTVVLDPATNSKRFTREQLEQITWDNIMVWNFKHTQEWFYCADIGVDTITVQPEDESGNILSAPVKVYVRVYMAGVDTFTVPSYDTTCKGDLYSLKYGIGNKNGTLQWQEYLNGTWADIAGATDSIYALQTAALTGAHKYRCVYNKTGCGNLISNVKNLVIQEAPSITSLTPKSRCGSGTSTLSAVASNGIVNWYSDSLAVNLIHTGNSFTTPLLSATKTYYVQASGGDRFCKKKPIPVTATINTFTSIVNQPQNTEVCLGGETNIIASVQGTNLTYQWKKADANVGTNNDTLVFSELTNDAGGLYYCTITGACGTVNTNTVTLTVNQSTILTQNPVGANFCEGENSWLSVAATGSHLTYQWKSQVADVAGNNNDTLMFLNAVADNIGTYTCKITGACGEVESQSAVLLVKANAKITVHPYNNSWCTGGQAEFSITASGYPSLSYQWQKDGVDVNDGVNSSGYYSTLTVPNAQTANAGNYYCIVSGGCGKDTSNIAVLQVREYSSVVTQPVNTTACAGDSVALTFDVNGTVYSYNWFVNRSDGQGFVQIGGNSNVLSFNNPTPTLWPYSYYCRANVSCGQSLNSNTVSLTSNYKTRITSGPNDIDVCVGATRYTTPGGVGGNLYTEWRSWYADTLVREPGTAFGVENAAVSDSGTFYCILKGDCGVDTSHAIRINVSDSPDIISMGIDGPTCIGHDVKMYVTATGGDLSYYWYKRLGAGPSIGIGSNNDTIVLANFTSADRDYTYYCMASTGCGGGSDVVFMGGLGLTQQGVYTGSATADTMTLCEGSNISIWANVDWANSWQWYKDGETFGTNYNAISIDNITQADSGYYYCTATDACGTEFFSPGRYVRINSAPLITKQPQTDTVCGFGSTAVLSVEATGGNLSYEWLGQNVFTPEFVRNNISEGEEYNTYSCKISNNCGTVWSEAVWAVDSTYDANYDEYNIREKSIHVIPLPEITHASPNITVCSGQDVMLSGVVTGKDVSVSWKKNGANVGTANNTGTFIDIVPVFNEWYPEEIDYYDTLVKTYLSIENIDVSQAGDYYMIAKSNCGSDTVIISVQVNFSGKILSYTDGLIEQAPGTATLKAVSNTGLVKWYDAFTGGDLIATSNSFITPELDRSKSYFAEAALATANTCTPRTLVQANVLFTDMKLGNGLRTIYDSQDNVIGYTATDTVCKGEYVDFSLSRVQAGYKYDLYMNSSIGDDSLIYSSSSNGSYDSKYLTGFNGLDESKSFKVKVTEGQSGAVALGDGYDDVEFSGLNHVFTNKITVEAWVYQDQFYANPKMTCSKKELNDQQYTTWMWNDDKFYVNYSGTWKTLDFPTGMPDGWTHVATVADENGMKIYYNGVEVASSNDVSTANIKNIENASLILGRDGRYPDSYYWTNVHNSWDELRVWKIARTAADINSSMNSCLTGSEAGLLQYTSFNRHGNELIMSEKGVAGIYHGEPGYIPGKDICSVAAPRVKVVGPYNFVVNNDQGIKYLDYSSSGCAGNENVIQAITNGTASWYATDTSTAPFFTGNELIFNTSMPTDTFFIARSSSKCVENTAYISIYAKPEITRIPSITVCEGTAYEDIVIGGYDEDMDDDTSMFKHTGNYFYIYDSISGGSKITDSWAYYLDDYDVGTVATENDTLYLESWNYKGCSSARMPIYIYVKPMPALHVADTSRCGPGDITVKVQGQGDIKWYNSPEDYNQSNFLAQGDSLVLTSLSEMQIKTSYVVAQYDGCLSDLKPLVVIAKKPGDSGEATIVACDNYTWQGLTYTSDTTVSRVITGVYSCDSTATIHLAIKHSSTGDTSATACGSFTWYGEKHTASGSFTHVVGLNAQECDSTVTLLLTINNSTESSITVSACGPYTWQGTIYSASGIYMDTIFNATGCDSVMTLNLTIENATSSSETADACDSYSWLGNIYTSSGTYMDTIANAAGCDSLMTLNLTIKQSNTGDTTATACDSFTWYGNNYTSTGTPTHALANAAGCDSTVTLHLTINNKVNSSTTEVACGSYKWNDVIYTASGTYTFTAIGVSGCDSLASLLLTINPLPTPGIIGDLVFCNGNSVTLTATGGTNYLWQPANISSASATFNTVSTLTLTVTDDNNCSSTVSSALVENETPLVSISGNTTVCEGDSIKLYASAIGAGITNYSWNTGSTAQTITEKLTTNTSFTLTGISNGCTQTAITTITVVDCSTGVGAAVFNSGIPGLNVYPNPTSGDIAISFKMNHISYMRVMITDVQGQIIFIDNTNTHNGEYKTHIDMSNISKGIYFLNIITDTGIATRRIIVQ